MGTKQHTTKDNEVWDISQEEHCSDGAFCLPVPNELRARKSRKAASRPGSETSWDGGGRTLLLSIEIKNKAHIDNVVANSTSRECERREPLPLRSLRASDFMS